MQVCYQLGAVYSTTENILIMHAVVAIFDNTLACVIYDAEADGEVRDWNPVFADADNPTKRSWTQESALALLGYRPATSVDDLARAVLEAQRRKQP